MKSSLQPFITSRPDSFWYKPEPWLLQLVLALLLMILMGLAHADEYGTVNQLIKQGKLETASQKIENFLKDKPQDAQMRFLKGMVLSQQKRSTEAQAVFSQLTEDFPELPEPYNNLAVLYAEQGLYDKARVTLEAALRNNPAYSTARENLGDVYLRLAQQTFEKVIQTESNNQSAQYKLDQLRSLNRSHSKIK